MVSILFYFDGSFSFKFIKAEHAAQLVECLPSKDKAWGSFLTLLESGILANVCNPRTWEVETEGTGHLLLGLNQQSKV